MRFYFPNIVNKPIYFIDRTHDTGRFRRWNHLVSVDFAFSLVKCGVQVLFYF